jgi:hypothetical protein
MARVARALIAVGVHVNGESGEQETPLITAASYGAADVARSRRCTNPNAGVGKELKSLRKQVKTLACAFCRSAPRAVLAGRD